MAKGVALRRLSRRGSWVQIPPSAPSLRTCTSESYTSRLHSLSILFKKILKPATIKRKVKTIKSLLKHEINIADPDKVIAFINTVDSSSDTKDKATRAGTVSALCCF